MSPKYSCLIENNILADMSPFWSKLIGFKYFKKWAGQLYANK